MKKLFLTAGLVGVMMLSACSSSDDIAGTDNKKVEVGGDRFTFTAEPFGADETVTRAAAGTGDTVQTVNLGDGIEAEVKVSQDAPTPRTRATQPISDGHYTIYAVDASTNTRVTGTNSKVSGNVSSGVFTKDPGTRLELSPGTYTFVCFNDAVTDNGNSLTVTNGNDALIGTATETISGDQWKVNFTLKRQMARIKFNIVSSTSEGTGITGVLTSTGANNTSITYAVDGTTQTSNTTSTLSVPQTVPTSGTAVNDAITRTYNNATDYNYLLPGAPINTLTFSFTGGTLYGKSLAGKSLSFVNSLKTLTRAGSYTINIKLSTFIFLFDDGTVGAIDDKGSRTAIAYVVKDKTATSEGTAMAMEEAQHGGFHPAIPEFTSAENSVQFDQTNWLTDMDGYKYTWEPSGSADGVTIKAQNPDNQAFYLNRNYVPSFAPVTGANVGRWYIPAMGELYMAFKRLRIADISQSSWSPDYTYITPYSTAAGGSVPGSGSFMFSSTEIRLPDGKCRESGIYLQMGLLVPFWPKHQPVPVWPFVHY